MNPAAYKKYVPLALLVNFYVGFYHVVNLFVFAFIGSKETEIPAYNWVKAVYFYGKRQQMFAYLANSLSVFLFLFGVYLIWSTPKLRNLIVDTFERFSYPRLVASMAAAFVFNFGFYRGFNIQSELVKSLPYAAFAFGAIIYCIGVAAFLTWHFSSIQASASSRLGRTLQTFQNFKPAAKVGLLIGILFLGWAYWKVYQPLYNSDLPFLNEYLNFNTSFTFKDKTVQTLAHINSIKPLGLKIEDAKTYDLKIDRPFLKNDNPAALEKFAADHPEQFVFDPYMKVLLAVGPISQATEEKMLLDGLASEKDLEDFFEKTDEREDQKSRTLSSDEKKFVTDFTPLFMYHTYSRWYFHHHNFVWGPLNKVYLGYDWQKVFFQYGVLGAQAQTWLAKAVFGSFNLETYFKVWVIYFLLYFLLFVACVYLITKDLSLTFIGTAIYLAFLYSQTYEHAFLGPGLNPIRHFFDVLVFLCFASYLRQRNLSMLIATSLACYANFMLNPEFGLFCYLAFLFGLTFMIISERKLIKKSEFAILGAFAVAHAIAWFTLRVGTEGVVGLYLGGFFSPVVEAKKILACFLVLLMAYIGIFSIRERLDQRKFNLFIAVSVYFVVLFSYYLWGKTWNHIVNISSVIVLTGVIGMDLLLSAAPKESRTLTKICVVFLCLPLLLISFALHKKSEKEYWELLSKFDNIRWNIPGARILTSIPEAPVKESIDLIHKYSEGPKIVLFSKYDNILPIISQTYNALPSNEVISFLMSPGEYETLKNSFNKVGPDVFFADMDIQSPATDELIDPNTQLIGGFFLESSMRLERSSNMKRLFTEISQGYEKVDQAGFLAVWKKK